MSQKKVFASSFIRGIVGLSFFLNILFIYKFSKDLYKTHEKSHPSEKVEYLFNRQTVYENLQIGKKDIVFIGDSHTQKFDLIEFLNNVNTKNRGIDGDVTAGVLQRLDAVTNGHPEKIFLQVGINDIFLRQNLTEAIPNYKRIIRKILKDSPESKIYIQSIFPSKLADRDTVIKYNRVIKQISKDNGLTFINLYDSFNDKGELNKKYDCGDAIHLNGAGYVLWTKILKPYL